MSTDHRSEIYKLLKIGENPLPKAEPIPEPNIALSASPFPSVAASAPLDLPVLADLPIVDFAQAWETKPMADSLVENILASHKESTAEPQKEILPFKEAAIRNGDGGGSKSFVSRLRGLLVYPVIFVVSFAFFYVLLNFSSLTSQVNAWFSKPEDEQILKEDMVPFYNWIGGYYFAVHNAAFLEPANDIDKDGLSNLDEFIIKTNPTISDSDGDGSSDGIEIINSTNPWGEGSMTVQQKKLREEMDIIKINNRINFNVVAASTIEVAPKIEYDLSRPGTLSIPKLSMQVPLVWSKDPADFDHDLTTGVVHYPGTALPGEQGTVYVSGHSSDYFWKKHAFRQVFARINALEIGDDIFIDIYGQDGKVYNYRYQVSEEKVYRPDDQTQFIDNSQAKLNLSTCWPIGTQKDRYVVSAVLVSL